MIDLHCHFLPGIDDGPEDLQDSLDLARAAVADGITHSVLTSHVYPGRFPNQRQNLQVAIAEFTAQLQLTNIALKVSLGCEAHLSPELIDLIAEMEVPFLGEVNGYRILLLEFPPQIIPVGSLRFVNALLQQKIRPLIAHPERNKDVMINTEKIRPFTEAGCWLQLTAGSLAGRFGVPAQQTAFKLIDEGWNCVAATDAHNMRYRPPLLSEGREALRARYGDAVAQAMVHDKPAAILGHKND
ncbi:MAG: CpsB/CapC family capsule biosynthesis tyrosine phosphatase [Comamonadaceae bacterium]|jgi:protein-tyrosine phosphatase